MISKTNAYSHRASARTDGLRRRAQGRARRPILGEARLIGLFTSKAYMEPASKTPLLHHKLEQILAAEDLIPGSHDYKTASSCSGPSRRTSCSRHPTEELRRSSSGLLQFEKHGGIRVLVRKDLFGRQVSIVVALPREKFSATLRKRLQHMLLERFNGVTSTTPSRWARRSPRKIFFTVHVEPGTQIPEIPYEELEEEVERLARTWDDDLHDALARAREQRAGTPPRSTRLGSPTTTRCRTPTGRSRSTTC